MLFNYLATVPVSESWENYGWGWGRRAVWFNGHVWENRLWNKWHVGLHWDSSWMASSIVRTSKSLPKWECNIVVPDWWDKVSIAKEIQTYWYPKMWSERGHRSKKKLGNGSSTPQTLRMGPDPKHYLSCSPVMLPDPLIYNSTLCLYL